MHNEEIEQLKQALDASPKNEYIRSMLIEKMQQHNDYNTELIALLNDSIKLQPNQLSYKERLITCYFKEDKISTCIIMAEALDLDSLSLPTRSIIAKCYLREGNNAQAKLIYENILDVDHEFEDTELDESFRLKSLFQSLEDEDQDILFSKPTINFSDVGGMDDVKREIDLKIIKPLDNVELYAQYGKKIGGGILLYGPPGCGKTYIAKATAGQINANFISIGLDDILDMWQGNSEKNLHNYFELARSKTPCVVFLDEVDALGAKRSDLKQSAGKNIINQFLAELDGINANNDGLLIIGATNTPWHLDTAFRRPGRFDRIIFVPPPDSTSKEAILKLKLKGKPHENIDYKKIAKKTSGYSGADINAMIDIAVEHKLEDAMTTGIPKPIKTKDLLEAAAKHKASTVDWFTTAKNYALFANKSGLYDDILKYMK